MHQSCEQPSCTRADHLRAGNQAENLASAAGRDRSAGWRHTGRADRAALTAGYDPQRRQAALDAGDPRAHWAVLF